MYMKKTLKLAYRIERKHENAKNLSTNDLMIISENYQLLPSYEAEKNLHCCFESDIKGLHLNPLLLSAAYMRRSAKIFILI